MTDHSANFGSYKNVILSKSISGTMYKIFPMTTWELVQVPGGSIVEGEYVPSTITLDQKWQEIENSIGTAQTTMNTNISNAIDALRREIMGLGENETAAQVIGTTYDTIKEIAAFLTEHEDANDAASYLHRVASLETLVGHAAVAQVGEQGDPDYVAPVSATGLFAADAALSARISALEAVGACKVEDGDTNGTIKVNNVTVTVYDGDPTLIQQDATHRFTTDLEKTKWNGLVSFVASIPAQPDADTLYLLEVV